MALETVLSRFTVKVIRSGETMMFFGGLDAFLRVRWFVSRRAFGCRFPARRLGDGGLDDRGLVGAFRFHGFSGRFVIFSGRGVRGWPLRDREKQMRRLRGLFIGWFDG